MGGALTLHVGTEVLGTQCDTDQTLGSGGDLVGVDDAQRTFDGGHHQGGANGDAVLDFHFFDDLFALDDVLCAFGLGHTQYMGTGADHGLDVGTTVGRIQRIDADHQLGGAVVDGLQGVVDQHTSRVLFGHGDRVLQVEHQRVGTVNMCVAHHAGVVARNEHHGAAQSLLFMHDSYLPYLTAQP